MLWSAWAGALAGTRTEKIELGGTTNNRTSQSHQQVKFCCITPSSSDSRGQSAEHPTCTELIECVTETS